VGIKPNSKHQTPSKKIGIWLLRVLLLALGAIALLVLKAVWPWLYILSEHTPPPVLPAVQQPSPSPTPLSPSVDEKPKLPVAVVTTAVATQMDFELVGTFVSTNAGEQFARIGIAGQGVQRYFLGDRLLNQFPMTAIHKDRIEFFNSQTDRLEFLEIRGLTARKAGAGVAPTPLPPFGIRPEGDSTYRLDGYEWREKFDPRTNNPFMNAHLTPRFNAGTGRVEGYEVKLTNPNSIWHAMGVQNGDILLKIDGRPTVNADEMDQGFRQIKGKKGFSVEVKRGGKIETLTFDAD